jgi:hypothetical protein
MQTQWDLTTAEARAVTNLWRLRHQHPYDLHTAISTADLAKLLGTRPEDLVPITRKARRVLPSSLTASDARLSWLEAETILAIHASRGTSGHDRLPLTAVAGALGVSEEALHPFVRDARERLSAAESITREPDTGPNLKEGFTVAIGENPFSWQIMWGVVLLVATVLGAAFLLSR